MDLNQTTLGEDKQGVALLEEALSEAYENGFNDATDKVTRGSSDVTADPQPLWEKLMQIIGVIV